MSKAEELEAHILEILNFADKVFEGIVSPDFQAIDPRQRYDFFMTKYPQFNKAYPVVSKYMVLAGKYNRIAFRKFITYLGIHQSKSLEEYCSTHSEYVRILYLVECKIHKQHPNKDYALRIKEMEYKILHKVMREIKQIEREETATYNSEQEKLLDFKRNEVLNFLNFMTPPPKEKTLDEMDPNELSGLLYTLQEKEDKLLSILTEKNEVIYKLESKYDEWVPTHLRKYTQPKSKA